MLFYPSKKMDTRQLFLQSSVINQVNNQVKTQLVLVCLANDRYASLNVCKHEWCLTSNKDFQKITRKTKTLMKNQVSNPYDFPSCMEHKRWCKAEQPGLSYHSLLLYKKKKQAISGTTFCVFRRWKEVIGVYNNLRMTKWWQNLHLWVNCPFKTHSPQSDNLSRF